MLGEMRSFHGDECLGEKRCEIISALQAPAESVHLFKNKVGLLSLPRFEDRSMMA